MFATLALVAALCRPNPDPIFTLDEKIPYRTVGKTKLLLDLYRPAASTRRAPLLLVVHGGSWMFGKRQDMAPLCEQFAKKGIAVATVDYRLAPKSKWPSMLEDCEVAYGFLMRKASDYQLDKKRVGLCGASAGGHIVLLMATKNPTPEMVKAGAIAKPSFRAVLNLFGPTDLSQDFSTELANATANNVLGKPYASAKDDIFQMSPVNFVHKGMASVFTIHGEADGLVPVKQAHRLDDALAQNGVDHVLKTIPGMDHGLDLKNNACLLALDDGLTWTVKKLSS